MSIDEIHGISAEECEARLAEIKTEMNAEDANIEALSAEVDAIEERRKALISAEEQRKALAEKVANNVIAPVIEERKEEKKMDNIEIRNSKAYVDAYARYIQTEDDAECRALLTENVNGDVPVPDLVYGVVKTAWEKDDIMSLVTKTYIKGRASSTSSFVTYCPVFVFLALLSSFKWSKSTSPTCLGLEMLKLMPAIV